MKTALKINSVKFYLNFNNTFSECLFGYYGTDCREQCRGHCKNNKTCDHISGKCPDGCEDGYTGKLCNNCTKHVYSNVLIRTAFYEHFQLYKYLTS